MRWSPAYFEVVRPFRYYRQMGITESNTWIGRSQAFDNVYDVLNAKPGDVLHDLPGGTFLMDGEGKGWRIALMAPAPLLEHSYGANPEAEKMKHLEASGALVSIPKPDKALDHPRIREEAGRKFPPLSKALNVLEASPELVQYRAGPKKLLTSRREDLVLTDFDSFRDLTVGSVVEDENGDKARLAWLIAKDVLVVSPVKGRPSLFEPLYGKHFSARELEALLDGAMQPATGKP